MRREDGWYWVKIRTNTFWEVAEYSASTNLWYRTSTMTAVRDNELEYIRDRLKEPEDV